ncbi:MAG: hypothetical protein R3B68_09285 [Phycisphaerales bacterium]
MTWFPGFELPDRRETDEVPRGVEGPELERAFELSPAECRYLAQVEGLAPTQWAELPATERLESLRELEQRLAEIEGRPAVELRAEPLGPGRCGYYDSERDVMVVSESLLLDASPLEAIDTVAHEGRHAYQHYAVAHPEIHGDPFEVASWAENFEHYLSAEMYGYELYRNQPVEADAWAAGALVRGIFSKPEGA